MNNKTLPENTRSRAYIDACMKKEIRRCSCCKKIKPLNNFYKDRNYMTSRCKECCDNRKTSLLNEGRKNLSEQFIISRISGTFVQFMRRTGTVFRNTS